MARSVNEIYQTMIADKAGRSELAELTSSSVTAIWRLMLYIVAAATHATEVLWDVYLANIERVLAERTPHRPQWYVAKAKQYMEGMSLPDGSDTYDTTGMSAAEIEQLQVVKYAAAVESIDMSVLYVKIAGEVGGELAPLPEETATSFAAYMNEVKDVGVRIRVINQAADVYNCTVKVLYNPMLSPSVVGDNVRAAIEGYITGLPFNGEYSNMALVDAVQQAEGVKIAELTQVSVSPAGASYPTSFALRYVPEAGYMIAGEIVINLEPYVVYASV